MQGRGVTSFYVPEIGDRFTLIADWSFTLFGESRNVTLINLLGLNDEAERIKAQAELARLRKLAYEEVVTHIPVGGMFNTSSQTIPRRTHRVRDAQAQAEWQKLQVKIHAWPYEAVLPAGTELQLDRVYIRKGSKDFSSLTFYIVQTPLPILAGTLKSGRRFWAKLPDCNRMEVERPEAPQLALAS